MTDAQIQIPFAGGPDEQADPRHLPPGSVIAATNQVYDMDGSYQVRLGYTQLAGGIATVKRLAVFANELCAIDGDTFWSWSAQGGTWVSKDGVAPVGCTRRPLMSNAAGAYQSQGEAYGSGYRVVAWIDPIDNQPRASVLDSTDALVYGPTVLQTNGPLASTVNVNVGVIGTTAIVVVSSQAAGPAIQAWTLALSTLGAWSATATKLDTGGSFPLVASTGAYACAFSATKLFIGYEAAVSGTAKLILRSFNAALALQTETATALIANASVPSTLIMQAFGACVTDAENLWIAVWALAGSDSTQGLFAAPFNPSTLVLQSGTWPKEQATATGFLESIQTIGVCRLTAVKCCIAYTWVKKVSSATMFWYQLDTSGTVTNYTGSYNCALASQPFFVASLNKTFCLAKTTAQYNDTADALSQFSYLLLDLKTEVSSTARRAAVVKVIAPFTAGSGNNLGAYQTNVSAVCSPTSTTYEAALLVGRGSNRYGMDRVTIDTAATNRWRPSYLGREGYLGSERYDGERVVECGFASAPHVVSATASGSGSLTGTWQYLATYSYIDDAGNEEESAPGPTAATVTGASASSIAVVVSCITATQKQRVTDFLNGNPTRAVVVNLYRTQVTTSGDSNYYMASSAQLNLNSFFAETITITDTLGDGNLTDGTHRLLYTLSGELPHVAPESFVDSVAHINRIWGIGADQRTIWYSQQYSDGNMPSFAILQTLTVDDTDEPLVALASLYDKLLVFTAHRVYVVFGQGPSIAGTANDLQEPQRIPSPGGCIDARSIVATPQGVMFQSASGLMLVDNGLGVSFVGAKVAVTTNTYPICTSAVFCQSSSTVRFTFTTSEAAPQSAGALGVVVLYDTRRERWAVHAITKGGNQTTAVGAPMQSATYHPTLGYVAGHNDTTSGCLVYRENTTADAVPWVDFGSYFVPLSVTMAWLKSGDLQGWQRVRRVRVLANYYDPHALTVALSYDYQASSESHAYTSAAIAALVSGSVEQVKVVPAQGKSEAIQVTLSTSAPTSPQVVATGRGAGFTGVALEVLGKRGGYRNLGAGART